MKTEHLTRFSSLPWMREKHKNLVRITQIGVGGIGSWAALFLSRIGWSMRIYDDDVVSETNIGGQFYTEEFIGVPKVEAVKELIEAFSGEHIEIVQERVNKDSNILDPIHLNSADINIILLTPDNMEARKTGIKLYEDVLKKMGSSKFILYIDGRMEAETAQIYCVYDEETLNKYKEEALFDDKDVPDLQCSFRATTHNGALIGSIITTLVTNYVTNVYEEEDIREIPFKTSYMLPGLTFNIERHATRHNLYKTKTPSPSTAS